MRKKKLDKQTILSISVTVNQQEKGSRIKD